MQRLEGAGDKVRGDRLRRGLRFTLDRLSVGQCHHEDCERHTVAYAHMCAMLYLRFDMIRTMRGIAVEVAVDVERAVFGGFSMSLGCSCLRGSFKFEGAYSPHEMACPAHASHIHRRMSIQHQRFLFLVLHAI